MSEVQFLIPAQTGYHLLSARDKGQSAARSRIIGWAVAGTEMLVMTEDGLESLGYTNAIMFPNNRVKSGIGEFDNVPAWLVRSPGTLGGRRRGNDRCDSGVEGGRWSRITQQEAPRREPWGFLRIAWRQQAAGKKLHWHANYTPPPMKCNQAPSNSTKRASRMKYTITINQAGIVDSGYADKTDITDWAIIEYICAWQRNTKAIKRGEFVWINYRHLAENMPLLGSTASRRYRSASSSSPDLSSSRDPAWD